MEKCGQQVASVAATSIAQWRHLEEHFGAQDHGVFVVGNGESFGTKCWEDKQFFRWSQVSVVQVKRGEGPR